MGNRISVKVSKIKIESDFQSECCFYFKNIRKKKDYNSIITEDITKKTAACSGIEPGRLSGLFCYITLHWNTTLCHIQLYNMPHRLKIFQTRSRWRKSLSENQSFFTSCTCTNPGGTNKNTSSVGMVEWLLGLYSMKRMHVMSDWSWKEINLSLKCQNFR